MLKVTRIVEINQYTLTCEFDSGAVKKLDILPLIENQKHLNGVASLKNKTLFDQVAVGPMGEVFWPNIVNSKSGDVWNYDISPEYVFFHGSDID
ncbi:DUF2442 domain-containing protein [Flavobacterium aurantiibacter]|uniref:DUF2442 domain-containing protein n=1 Tax=Flavobacterium aurantiibacter TaxID=2023067 RepID=A0A256A497_9FLAO|nr:DUF2442 domain-containing protein [Flavobacterium aurantiibacter]OYQ48677.1 hypothetical protein CHX27_01965 [Flavobacterium aurantiibacter]